MVDYWQDIGGGDDSGITNASSSTAATIRSNNYDRFGKLSRWFAAYAFQQVPDQVRLATDTKKGMAPKSLMVQQCSKVEATSRFVGRFYDRPHLFSINMQEETFDWLDQWLKP